MKRNNKLKIYTLEEVVDKHIGRKGTPNRDRFERKLQMEIIRDYIKMLRKERKLTQEQLGKLVGVQKAQISKLENSPKSARFDTILNVFDALNAEIVFDIKIKN
jgi:HTH-type transcriptional regulator / antitoxin HipB